MKRIWFILVVLLVFIGIVSAVQLGISGGQEQRPPSQAPEPLRQETGTASSGTPVAPEAEQEGKKPSAGGETLPDPKAVAGGEAKDPLLAPEARTEAEPPAGEAVKHGTVEKGDTLSTVLESVSTEGSFEYANAVKQVFSLRAFRAGQPYVVVTDNATGRVKRFEYEIDGNSRLVVEGMEDPVARVERIEYVILLETIKADIQDNLFQAVADMGEGPQIAILLAELFGSEINFIRDLQPGDSFSVLVEKRYRDGEYKGYGRILAATFTNQGKTFEAFYFKDGKERPQYYNRKGENLRKTLLQAPLSFTRITSRFSHNRKHPVLGYSRPHLGVDYGAPTGTPVKAVGDGVVIKRGWAGGYGNQIILKHEAGLESWYAHLSGYARGLKKGQRVRQGQVIGFVGSTGLSTGPHLDFRLKQNGKFINPVKAINPRGKPVSKGGMKRFNEIMKLESAYLNGEKSLSDYTVDSIVSLAPASSPGVREEGEDKAEDDTKSRRRRQR
ncbi:peptidoglycan DD-metalloendopeptidase family protein [uncultured Desulfovibrio sp.]|uniref:M23 family metallopeptidase n=1 Tax=uncultured Desulfovibrio sp. TaxID=167968 RepID=UPI002613AEC0|nr:peptidoglycan DD-metalloendopeptidase family protein [uncultured Desulfovibrio sp.]